MTGVPLHTHEAVRVGTPGGLLLALQATPHPVLQTVTSLACQLLELPVAMVTLVDDEDLHTLAATGMEPVHLPRTESGCGWTVAVDGTLRVPDLRADPRFQDGPMVAAGLRSYHGVPLRGPDGLPVGGVCVMGREPRSLTAAEVRTLAELAEVASSHLELVLRRDAETASGAAARAVLRGGACWPHAEDPELADGLAAGELVPWFQPILSLADDRVVGVEALARWEHPVHGLLEPAAFLQAAEGGELVLALDETMLEEACHQVQLWRTTRPEVADLELSVNVSGRHLQRTDLVEVVAGALRRSGLPAPALTLELTETALVEAGTPGAEGMLRGLRALGVGLALDDYGTGYSTLTYLQRFPVTQVKVDRSFVAGLGAGQRDVLLVDSVVQLAQRLGLDVVAEGVETLEQLEVLRELGCAKGQGYHLQRPLGPEELELSGMLGDAVRREPVLLTELPSTQDDRLWGS